MGIRFCIRLLSVVAILLPALPSFGAAPTFTQMWKGEELYRFGGSKYAGRPQDWRSMPGALLGFHYSGKGPLPAAKEFVVTLDKPLPLGAYRLFVKNFFRGKMEATVGDVTRPLEIRRFDWTPGVLFEPNVPVEKIVLRYFPSTIVADTGVAQTQTYIVQGVFITTDSNKVPIRGGEIVTSLPDEVPPAQEGNYLQNASFETGLFPWGKPLGMSTVYGAGNLDETTAAQGKCSFKMPAGEAFGVESPMLRLAPGKYSLSFYAKSDHPLSITAAVSGLTEDLKAYRATPVNKVFELTDQWQRFSVSGDIASFPGALYTVRFTGRAEPGPFVWLDGVQLQNGEVTKFESRRGGDVGYISKVPGNIFYEGEASDIDLLVSGATTSPHASVGYRVIDLWGTEADHATRMIDVHDGKGCTKFPLYAGRRGLFRATFTLGSSSSEMVYSVLPRNTHLHEKYPQGSLGADASLGDAQLEILKRANFNWIISKTLGRWNIIEREEGKFVFNDAGMAAADRAKMVTMIQLLMVTGSPPPWTVPLQKPKGGAAWDESKYIQHWANFTHEVADHFKSVHHWEIENEPNYRYTGAEYGRLLKTASDSIRKVDPGATIVGMSGGGFRAPYYEDAVASAGENAFDVFSIHFYGNEPDVQREFAELCGRHHKPAYNTETGLTCGTFFTALPTFDSLRNKEYWTTIQKDVQGHAIHTAHNYLLSRSLGRMDKYFHYFARFVNSGPSQPTLSFGGGKDLVEYDGSLRANGVVLAIASHFFDEAKYVSAIDIDPLLETHVFEKAGGSVGFCWCKEPRDVRVEIAGASGDVKLFDMMGNAMEGVNISVAEAPVYFTSRLAPTALVNVLKRTAKASAR